MRGVEHQDSHVAALDGAHRAEDRIELKVLADLLFLAQSCGVDKVEVEAKEVVMRKNGVACGAGDGCHDVAFLAGDGVDEGGLAHVGATNDGNARQVVLAFLFSLVEVGDQGVKQVSGTGAGDAGDGV